MTTHRDDSLQAIGDPKVRAVLERLHAEADRQNPRLLLGFASQLPRLLLRRSLPWERLEHKLDDKFICIDRDQGVFCYLLARAVGARRIVEFGTSFGVSTLYLALAVRENGGGVVYGTEFLPGKAARAREHLEEAGVGGCVEILEGDARETLRSVEAPVDFMLNDGFPRFQLEVLQVVAPKLREGALVVTDNVGAAWADDTDYLSWVRDPANGFASAMAPRAAARMKKGTELSLRLPLRRA